MDENEEFVTLRAVDIERFHLRRPVAERFRLAEAAAHGVARRRHAPDDLVGVRHEGALLVLRVEPGLVVVSKNGVQAPRSLASLRRLAARPFRNYIEHLQEEG